MVRGRGKGDCLLPVAGHPGGLLAKGCGAGQYVSRCAGLIGRLDSTETEWISLAC